MEKSERGEPEEGNAGKIVLFILSYRQSQITCRSKPAYMYLHINRNLQGWKFNYCRNAVYLQYINLLYFDLYFNTAYGQRNTQSI